MERTDSWQLSKRSCYLKHVASLNCTRPHIRYGKKVDRVPKVYLKPGGCRVLFPFFLCTLAPSPLRLVFCCCGRLLFMVIIFLYVGATSTVGMGVQNQSAIIAEDVGLWGGHEPDPTWQGNRKRTR